MSEPSPLTVLAVIDSLGAGGAERSLVEMIPLLVERGIAVSVACFYDRSEGVVTEPGTIQPHVVAGSFWPIRIWALRDLIARTRPGLVHTTLFKSDVAARLAAIGTGVPVVTSLVNTTYDPIRLADPNVRRWRLRAAQLLDAVTARLFVRRFHAITEAVARSAVEHLRVPRDRIDVVPRGRRDDRLSIAGDRQAIRSSVRSELDIDQDDLLVVTVGRQEYQKGHVHLIDAFDLVAAARGHVSLVIAGRTGAASNRLAQSVARATHRDLVHVLGHRTDVPRLLSAADLFVFPSLYEGQGGALVEAMAVGLPIVTSDVAAIREVVGDHASLVPPGDVDRMAEAMIALLDNADERQRMGKELHRRFVDRFRLETAVDGMAAFYRRSIRQEEAVG